MIIVLIQDRNGGHWSMQGESSGHWLRQGINFIHWFITEHEWWLLGQVIAKYKQWSLVNTEDEWYSLVCYRACVVFIA